MKKEDYLKAHTLIEEIEAAKEQLGHWVGADGFSEHQQVIMLRSIGNATAIEVDVEYIDFVLFKKWMLNVLEEKIRVLNNEFESL